MIDLILLTFCAGLFAGGFWCGKTFSSFVAMKNAALKWFNSPT